MLSRWQVPSQAGPALALARLAVRTSMRNQLPCVVQRLEWLGQIVRVHLAMEGVAHPAQGDEPEPPFLSARITRESAELLGLQSGLAVQALCKATAVRVERLAGATVPPEAGVYRLVARAMRVARGESGDEVSAELAGNLQMVGFAEPRSGLRAGKLRP